jgi:transposase
MKSDPIDSDKMARALRAGMIKGIYIRERDNLDDRGLVRLRKSIQQDLTRYKNRVKHMLHANGVEIPEQFDRSCNWSKAFINWLREDVVLLSSTRATLDMLLDQVETVRQNLLNITKKVRSLRNKKEYAEMYDALTSIPGIGPICAITLLTEIYDVKRFKNERQFASYLGLVPTCHCSGEKASFGEMTFRGNKHLGPLLIEASWVAIQWDDALSVAFTNYRRKGLMPQESIIRVARKLSNIIFSMLKTGNHYAPANA